MPIAPIRDLGSVGVIADTDPYDNPVHAFTFASNVRFEDKRITRGPVFSTVGSLAINGHPRYAFSYKQLAGTQQYHVANRDGTVSNWTANILGGSSTESFISPVAYTPVNSDFAYTSDEIQDVVYLNRPDRAPWFKPKGATLFAPLPDVGGLGWNSTWRCGAIRSVGGVLAAINVTKGAISYPTMVKTSDFMAFGAAPAEWVADTTNSATEQIIADLAEPLIDGWPLRDKLMLYTENETWAMEPRYDNLMFNYRRIFTQSTSSGVINQNCVAEYNNQHYVFGSTDIWQHDGFNRKSLAAGKVRDFVYNSMDKTQSYLFFTQHNARLNEIMFCYVSNDIYCQFPSKVDAGCNRAAVFNYRSGTWYFYDLPYVTSGDLGVSVTGLSYTGSAPLTFADVEGSFASFGDATKPVLMFVGTAQSGTFGSLGCSVRAFDRLSQSASNGVLDVAATAPVFMENQGIDLDGLQIDLRSYFVIKAIYPEGRFTPDPGTLSFSFSTKDGAGAPQNAYSPPMTYDGNTLYKLDFNQAGRFLDMKITTSDIVAFNLSGLDVDLAKTGNR